MTLDLSIYLVADEVHFRRGVVEDQIVAAVQGGVRVVQLREKACSTDDFIYLARRVLAALKTLGVPVLINDRVDIALATGAHGVHVGQGDLHPLEARRILGPNAIIGLTVESEEQALAADGLPIQYLGVSSIFSTRTKQDIKKVWGLDGLARLRLLTRMPLVGIGGIDASNLAQVVRAGADGVAVVSAFEARENWSAKAQRLAREYRWARSRE